LAQSSRWGRIKAETVCAMSSKYAIALYEMVQLRGNLERCMEAFALNRFRDLLGVPPGAYERGNDFVKRVIDPAVIEVNGAFCKIFGADGSRTTHRYWRYSWMCNGINLSCCIVF
jgi:hypothetical protein